MPITFQETIGKEKGPQNVAVPEAPLVCCRPRFTLPPTAVKSRHRFAERISLP